MSRAGDDAERSDEEERRMSVMNGREVARESRDAQVFEFGTARAPPWSRFRCRAVRSVASPSAATAVCW